MIQGKFRLIGMVMMAAALGSLRHAADGQQNDAASVRRKFIGTWKLISAEEKLKDGTVRPYKELGPKAQGYLMYAADGHMCAELMNPERPRWDNPPTPAQEIAAIEGFLGYCGRFEIDATNHVMWHSPDLAWKPNYIGTRQSRPYMFERGHLVYSAKTPLDGEPEVAEWRIEWERAK